MLKLKFCMSLCFAMPLLFSQSIWIETTQEDFKDGTFERNLYAPYQNGGSVEFVPRFDLNNDGYLDLFVSQYSGNVYIYWGGATGYSINRRTSYSGGAGGNCDAADLNNDGYADFIISKYYSPSIAIFWGQQGCPNPNNQTTLSLGDGSNETCLIVDFNKDGYLDIAVGNYCAGLAAVFWGSSAGYLPENRTELPVVYLCGYNVESADFNKDNWLDLLFVNREGSSNYIYWGNINGFSASNRTEVPFLSTYPHGASVADLNNDGWSDLIFTGCDNIRKAYLYWGSSTGFQTHQILNLNSPTFGGSSINDFNQDGFLDILFIRGGGVYRPLIYWGSATGYSDANRIEIGINVNGSGGFVADLNYDGYLDVYVNNFAYKAGSPVFWEPNFNTYQLIPYDTRDHHAMAREIGNIYNRRYYDDYVSSVFDGSGVSDWGTIEWDATVPPGTSILFWVRSGNTTTPDQSWSDWCSVTNGGSIPEGLNAQYLQYKARFTYTNPSYLPALSEVRISYAPLGFITASIRIKPEVINLKSHGKFIAFITLPEGYNPSDIDISTVQCEGANAISGNITPICFIAKFNVQDLVGVVPGPAVEFTVTGQLRDGTP